MLRFAIPNHVSVLLHWTRLSNKTQAVRFNPVNNRLFKIEVVTVQNIEKKAKQTKLLRSLNGQNFKGKLVRQQIKYHSPSFKKSSSPLYHFFPKIVRPLKGNQICIKRVKEFFFLRYFSLHDINHIKYMPIQRKTSSCLKILDKGKLNFSGIFRCFTIYLIIIFNQW